MTKELLDELIALRDRALKTAKLIVEFIKSQNIK